MDEKFRKSITDILLNCGVIKSWEKDIISEKVIKSDLSLLNESEIGTASNGIKYNKKEVSNYLAENGYPFTQEYVDMAAKTLNAGTTQKTIEKVCGTELDNISDDDLNLFIQVKLLEQMCMLNNPANIEMEYHVSTVTVTNNDLANLVNIVNNGFSKAVNKELDARRSEGWILKNTVSIPNNVYCAIMLIFERPIKNR